MSWIMNAKILDIEQGSLYAANKKVYKYSRIWYKWEVI